LGNDSFLERVKSEGDILWSSDIFSGINWRNLSRYPESWGIF